MLRVQYDRMQPKITGRVEHGIEHLGDTALAHHQAGHEALGNQIDRHHRIDARGNQQRPVRQVMQFRDDDDFRRDHAAHHFAKQHNALVQRVPEIQIQRFGPHGLTQQRHDVGTRLLNRRDQPCIRL